VIHNWHPMSFRPTRIAAVSKGTYIRTLGEDIGEGWAAARI
jgi:tRNA U55 pseudouridine synthase TruB